MRSPSSKTGLRPPAAGPSRLLLAALLALLGAAPAAAASCPSTCVGDVAACRQRECGGLAGREHRGCVRACRARSTCAAPGASIRTLAYAMSECRQDAQGNFSGRQKFLVRSGDCEPVVVMEFPPIGPVADPFNVCPLAAAFRIAVGSVVGGLVQRVGVLPDASAVVFEVTDELSLFPHLTPEPREKGIFLVRADGTGLRRLGDSTRVRLVSVAIGPARELSFAQEDNPFFAASPDSRTIAFADLGPDPEGREAEQIFTMDVATGRRRQLTSFPPIPDGDGSYTAFGPFFVDDRTIIFFSPHSPSRSFRVGTDGHGLAPVEVPAIGEGRVVPQFGLAGSGGAVLPVALPGPAANPNSFVDADRHLEIFRVDGTNALQLTNFGRADTYADILGRKRVFFRASADPFGTTRRTSARCSASVRSAGGCVS